MLDARTSRLCASTSVKSSSPWSCDESKKSLYSGDLASFLVWERQFIWLHASLFTHVFMCHTPIRTWTTRELRPSLHTKVHPRTRVHIPEARWCLEWPRDVFMSHDDIWTCVRESQSNSYHDHTFSEQDLRKNLKFFNVSEVNLQSIYTKLTMRVFDVYTNILKYMYSTRFSGGSTRSETPHCWHSPYSHHRHLPSR